MIKKEKLQDKKFRLGKIQNSYIKLQAKKLKISEGEVVRRMVDTFIEKTKKTAYK